MRHSILVGMCCAMAVLASGCPKDTKGGGSSTAEDGGTAQTMQPGSGQHGGDTSHSGTGGSSGGASGASGGGGSGSGTMAIDGGSAHGPGSPGAKDGGSAVGDAGAAAGDAAAGDNDCATKKCMDGWHCEIVAVQCIRAPCPPLPECIMDTDAPPTCGGIAAFPCPGGGSCVDNPADSCDPKNGGADCGGICQCDKAASCVQGKHWNGAPSVCDCVADDGSSGDGAGPTCGKKTCNSGEMCCSPSCGICGKLHGLCPQIACAPAP